MGPLHLSATQWTLRELDLYAALDRIAAAGYSGVELGTEADARTARRALASSGLSATSVCPVWGAERDFASPTVSVRLAATDHLRRAIELAGEIGAELVIVVPSDRPDPPDGLTRLELLLEVAATLSDVAGESGPSGPLLVIEPLNRRETHLVRTLAEGALLCELVDSQRVALMADVFHMHLEEESLTGPLRTHASALRHVHLADSGRKAPGTGTLDLADVIRTLDQIGYSGAVGVECLPADDDALRHACRHIKTLVEASAAVKL